MKKKVFIDESIAYLKENNIILADKEINSETDLIETGLLDSFKIIDFIMFLESLTKKELSVNEFSYESIRNLEKIHKLFFENMEEN